MKTVIGLVGEKGSGKETVGDMLMEFLPAGSAVKKIARVRSSDILAETLTQWGLPLNRHNLQHLAIVMNAGFGPETLSNSVKNRIDTAEADAIIFDGIRWESDVKLLRGFEKNILIYITAPAELRYERTKKRKQKVGEGLISFEQFMKEEQVDTEVYIPVFGKDADIKIQNDKDVTSLKSALKKALLTSGLVSR